MGFLDSLRKAFGGGGSRSSSGNSGRTYTIYAKCQRCGEPLKGRVDMMNEPSLGEDEETWVVRKGLVGSGAQRCFQTVEVTLTFDAKKQTVIDSEVIGGQLITAEEYEALVKSQGDANA
jgi:hypothetical protein